MNSKVKFLISMIQFLTIFLRVSAQYYIQPKCVHIESLLTGCDCTDAGWHIYSNLCFKCPSGTISTANWGDADCNRCPIGKYTTVELGATQCLNCPAGSSSPESSYSSASCTNCGAGTYSTGASECKNCPSNSNSLAGSAQCQCVAGTYMYTVTCISCPSNSYTNVGSTSLYDCKCNAGTAGENGGGGKCTSCEIGKATIGSGYSVCTNCGTGTESIVAGASSCTNCPIGKSKSTAGEIVVGATYAGELCVSCAQGKYGASNGLSACADCDTGKYSDITGASACTTCEIGQYGPLKGVSACTTCPDYASSPSSSTSVTACTCNPGYNGQNGGVCTRCPVGTYKSVSGNATCTPCAVGTSNGLTAQPTCNTCSAGKYANTTAAVLCSLCPAGKYSSLEGRTNLQQCVDCSVGYYASTAGSAVCVQCDSKSYTSGSGSSTCTICGAASTSNPTRTTCVACPDGTEGINGICRDCDKGYYSSSETKLQCLRCRDGTYTAKVASVQCVKCNACPDGYYRRNCSISTGGGTCSLCDVCPTGYVNVGCMNRAGHTDERGTCRLRKYTSRTPLCDEKKSGFGLGGYTFARLFGVSQDDSSFQCRRRCDNVQNILSEDVYPVLRTELLAQFPDMTVNGKLAPRAFNGGYCGGPYACDVSNCNIAGSADDTQNEYQPMNACPMYMDKKTAEDFWAVAALPETLQTQSSVFEAVQAIRAVKCQTCAQCGQANTGLLRDWGRGCARDCTYLKCTNGLIFDWTEEVQAQKCKTCGQLNDVRLCLSSEQRAFDMYDVSGRLPKLYMQDCKSKNDFALQGYETTYGSCVKCADFVESCVSQDNLYYQTCENNGAGSLPVCAACSTANGREPTRSRYWDGQTWQNLYCQQKKCTVGAGVAFTGINRESTPHSVCHKQCTQKVCVADASQVLLPCVLPHAARCMNAINMDAAVTDTSYAVRQYAPAHVNMLEPATDALHLFASFENTLVDTQAYQNDLRAQCVWNADFIVDNNMNPGGVSSIFQNACRPWLRDPRTAYPLMPLQNTVTLDEVDGSVFSRRVLLNTSAQAVTYGSDGVDRPADVFAGDIYLKLNLSNTNNATLAVFVPHDRNITATSWVPRWRVSVHAQQIAGDTTSLLLSTPTDAMCLTCFSLLTF